jgi:hypothetical protein
MYVVIRSSGIAALAATAFGLWSGLAVAAGPVPTGERPMMQSPIEPVQYYGSCQRCRDRCYRRYRVYCSGPECRSNFVGCMRECWDDVCRR